jgi:hypothetical protein
MTTRVKTQIGEKTCDGCNKTIEVELAVNEGTPEFDRLSETLGEWYRVARKVYVRSHGQFMDMQAEACCLACVPAAAVKLAMPPTESPIDLRSLQVGSGETN